MRGWIIIFGILGVAGTAYSFAGTQIPTPSILSMSGLFFFLFIAGLLTRAVGGRVW